jgi:hypothetical protein
MILIGFLLVVVLSPYARMLDAEKSFKRRLCKSITYVRGAFRCASLRLDQGSAIRAL